MGGIAAIINFNGAPVEPGLIDRMTRQMAHRGPDGLSRRVSGAVALGHCLLRTTPESLEERQPLANEDDSLVLVMDGRVDNWEDLRRDLLARGARLRDRSDPELVLRAYETWSSDCLSRIDGDFALVIWDARRRTAFCARDRLGHKPFYYLWNAGTLVVASEVRAILGLPRVQEALNEGILAEYLESAWLSSHETLWRGILRLVAGHRMEVGPAGPAPVRYWAPGLCSDPLFRKDDDYEDAYRHLLNDTVRRHSRSHRPVACEVSGGLDSSAIFAVAVNARATGDLGAPGLDGYTLDFHGVPGADELEYVRAVETHLGTPILRVAPAQPPVAWYREQARLSREFPGYPNGVMAEHLRETARARGARVLLAGVGGDEWLGLGPPGHYYAEELALGNLREAAACLRTDIGLLGLPGAAAWAVRAGLVPLLPESVKRVGRRFRRTPPPRESWLASPLAAEAMRRRVLHASRQRQETPRRSQRWQLDTLMDAYSAVAREMEERSASRIGLELRLPLFDHRIVEFAFSTPERLRSIGRSMKHLHRRALAGLLPPLVLSRQTKADFMVVFRNQLDRLEGELRTEIRGRRGGWVRPDRAAYLVDHRRDSDVAGWAEWWLWALVGCDALV